MVRTSAFLAMVLFGFAFLGGLAAQDAEPQAEKSETAKGEAARGQDRLSGVIARVDGTTITADQYRVFLFHVIGKQRLEEFIDRLLVEREAKRLRVNLPYEIVDSAVKRRLKEDLRVFDADEKAYRDYLAKLGLTLEDQLARLRVEVVHELALDRCILQSRRRDDAALSRYFEERYGEDGLLIKLRHVLIKVPTPRGTPPPPELLDRAREILAEIERTRDFTTAVRKYSEDRETRDTAGVLPRYRPGRYGAGFDHAVSQLEAPGDLSGIVRSDDGFHILQLVARQKVRFEDVREKLAEELKTRSPTEEERRRFVEELRRKADVVLAAGEGQ